ncbi:hypothetical protein MCAL106L_0305 [Mycoplasmopsis californica]|uniref:hypothetical protein n=1 Tax=Mycoplasmopsis californica TaxID=2113 RepID=UPI000EB73764|nr:hypothetical protein [Mycoplasmopsis californica]BBG40806.1 hypothetical protein MCAL106_0305 [Mycoplasmopsis californica]BBG41400.1 hypothetical protein MCAL106E_0305 [Mycoplasmopsis californica]BBG41993.1 hypothetical protein MCAL106L_0305 [Mycoplasmopsis californica]
MSKAKGFAIGAISILGGAVAIGGTLSIISNRFEEITNKAILRYRDFNEPFIKNLDNILSSGDNIKQLKYLSDTLEVQLHSVELNALQKYVLIQQMGQKQKDIIYQWAQSQIDNDTLNAKSVLILRQLLEGQTKRIQELDLKAQFNSLELSNLKLSLYNFSSLSKQQQTKWFNDYKQALDFALDTQFKLVSQQLMQYKNSLDDNVLQLERLLPTKALKAKAVQNIHQIEDSIFEPSFRINDLARNKRVVEHILSDAKSTKFDVIREKFANNMDKMKSLVNANVVNVAQNIINYTNHIYPLSLDIQNQLLDLKTKLNVDANIEFNYAIIKTILESIENSQKLSKKEFIEILELNSVNNYLSLAHHYLQHTSQLLDTSVSEADLDNALNNLKTAKKMIDSSTSSIPVIVNEFKSFVNSFANSFTHLDKLFKSLSTDNAYVKVLSANADNYSKTDLIKGITKYRNLINQIYVSEQKLALNTNKLDLLATSETEIINKDEVAQFKKEIREIANSELDVVKVLELIETKINAIESLIDTRSEFKEIVNSVKNNVLDWNVTNAQIRAKYISNQAVQLGTDLINQVRDLVVKTELDSNKIVNTKYALREQLRSIQKIQLLHLQKQTHLDIVSLKNLDNLIATKFDTKTAQKMQ